MSAERLAQVIPFPPPRLREPGDAVLTLAGLALEAYLRKNAKRSNDLSRRQTAGAYEGFITSLAVVASLESSEDQWKVRKSVEDALAAGQDDPEVLAQIAVNPLNPRVA